MFKLSDALVGKELEHDELGCLWCLLEVAESNHAGVVVCLRMQKYEESLCNELSVDGVRVEEVEWRVEDEVSCWIIALTLEGKDLSVVTLAHPELSGLLDISCEINTPLLVGGKHTWQVKQDVDQI